MTDLVVQSLVGEVGVIVSFAVDVRTKLSELWLFTLVDYIEVVGAIVEVLVPPDADVVAAWDVFPVCLICLSQLGTFGCLVLQDCAKQLRRERRGNHEYHTGNKEADKAALILLELFSFDLAVVCLLFNVVNHLRC